MAHNGRESRDDAEQNAFGAFSDEVDAGSSKKMRQNQRPRALLDHNVIGQCSSRSGFGPQEARRLFQVVSQYRGRRYDFYEAVLAPAMPTWSGFAPAYARYRRFASAPPFRGKGSPWSDLHTFYALSRLFEWLTVGAQVRTGSARGWPQRLRDDTPPLLAHDELVRFFDSFGMTPMRQQPHYHRFMHEIVSAEVDVTLGDMILVEEEAWPGLWFGDLVFARAGVQVRFGPDAHFEAALAARSTLYFAWSRVHRPTCDLSHGWGSNSQWTTAFRRDYVDGAVLRYNVDGRRALASMADTPSPHDRMPSPEIDRLTEAERIELLTHRCFVRTSEPSDAPWPFNDTYTEPAPGPDWTW